MFMRKMVINASLYLYAFLKDLFVTYPLAFTGFHKGSISITFHKGTTTRVFCKESKLWYMSQYHKEFV